MEFGTLKYLELRSVWANEAINFTPWLADNIQVLGDLLGLDLELRDSEAKVGAFSCDLHAVDLASGRVVIIENQLEMTDHIHLGQLLTYAAGLEAAVIVWIAKEIRDEHRAALDWLNRKTEQSINFFAVIPRVFKIDDSRPSFELQLIVSPNEWEKEPPPTDDEIPTRALKYREFFQGIIEEARQNGYRGSRRAMAQNWLRLSTGRADLGCYIAFTSTEKLKVELYFEAKSVEINKARFDAVHAKLQEIEATLGKSLSWERLDEKIGSRIATYHDGSIESLPEVLESLSKWTLDELIMFRAKLFPAVFAIIDILESGTSV